MTGRDSRAVCDLGGAETKREYSDIDLLSVRYETRTSCAVEDGTGERWYLHCGVQLISAMTRQVGAELERRWNITVANETRRPDHDRHAPEDRDSLDERTLPM